MCVRLTNVNWAFNTWLRWDEQNEQNESTNEKIPINCDRYSMAAFDAQLVEEKDDCRKVDFVYQKTIQKKVGVLETDRSDCVIIVMAGV